MLGGLVGIHQGVISLIENRIWNPTPDQLTNLGRVFGVPPSQLLDEISAATALSATTPTREEQPQAAVAEVAP